MIDPHYFHPMEGNAQVCKKCGEPPHGLVAGGGLADDLTPGRYLTEPVEVDTPEQKAVLDEFMRMLRAATVDGGRKRATGVKPPWWRDAGHLPAIFSHINRYFHGEKVDPDSRAHPLVHLAWRALAIAYQETVGQKDPRGCVR